MNEYFNDNHLYFGKPVVKKPDKGEKGVRGYPGERGFVGMNEIIVFETMNKLPYVCIRYIIIQRYFSVFQGEKGDQGIPGIPGIGLRGLHGQRGDKGKLKIERFCLFRIK